MTKSKAKRPKSAQHGARKSQPAKHTASGVSHGKTKVGKVLRALATVPAVRKLDQAFLGGAAGKIFDALTGSGDYTVESGSLPYEVTANTVVHPKMTPSVPSMHDDRGATRIRHREFIGVVKVNAPFSLSPYRLQPGDDKTFPWLAPIARLFQQYKFLGVVFEFVTTSGVFNATSPALGQIIMATNYNVTQPVFTNEVNMLNSYFTCSGVPSTSLMHAVECEHSEQPYQLYYIRNPQSDPISQYGPFGPDPQGPSFDVRDPRLFDYAVFQFGSVGGPVDGGYVSGQLWITYDVMSYKPVIPDKGFSHPPPVISDSDRKEFGMVTQAEAEQQWVKRNAEKAPVKAKSGKPSSKASKAKTSARDCECPTSDCEL